MRKFLPAVVVALVLAVVPAAVAGSATPTFQVSPDPVVAWQPATFSGCGYAGGSVTVDFAHPGGNVTYSTHVRVSGGCFAPFVAYLHEVGDYNVAVYAGKTSRVLLRTTFTVA